MPEYLTNRTLLLAAGLLAALLLFPGAGAGGYDLDNEIEEIVVRIDIPRLMQKDIIVQYDGTDIYVPFTEVFSILEIYVETDFQNKIFTGKFLDDDGEFEINLPRYKAKCLGKTHFIDSTSYILGDFELYLRTDLYNTLFNIKMFFNFSDLSIYMPLNREYPIFQRLDRKKRHDNLLQKKIAARDVSLLPFHREFFKGGVADWSLSTSPIGGGGHFLRLGLGGMVAGGDLAVSGGFNSRTGFDTRELQYNWHYFFSENSGLTQAEFGYINTGGRLSRSLKGISVTNRPQIRRQYFQTIHMSDQIGPGWEVELYVNNRLIDFVYTDENGGYSFDVDIEYGTSRVLLKMYGPGGEIETEERTLTVPFNLIPGGTFEYTAAAGIDDTPLGDRKYGQVEAAYGLNRNITIGLSADIPAGNPEGEKPTMMTAATYQPLGNLLVNASFAPDYARQFSISYNKSSLVSIFGSYTEFYENEFRNRLNQQNNLQLTVSSPFKIGRRHLSPRFRVSIDNYPSYRLVNYNYSLKLPVYLFHLNYIGNYKRSEFTTRTDRGISSKLLLSSTLLRWIRPQIGLTYDHIQSRIIKAGLYVSKRIFRKGQLSLSVERNTLTGTNLVMLTFNIYNDFAHFSTRMLRSENQTAVTQTQKGSIRFNQDSQAFRFIRNTGIGSGSAVIWPFLDQNFNGTLDDGEPLLTELNAKIGGATGLNRRKGQVPYYDNLRPYDPYIVEIDPYSLDDPTLRPAHENFKVMLNPNIVTEINVPVVTAGEVAGKVDRKIPEGIVGIGGIRVFVVNEVTGKETELITFNNGEYFYLGLIPGMYRAYIDPGQLDKYGYLSEPASRRFQIKTVEGGDYVDNINFVIIPK